MSAQRVFQKGKMFLGDWRKFFPQYCTQHSETIVLTVVVPQCDLVCHLLTPESKDLTVKPKLLVDHIVIVDD